MIDSEEGNYLGRMIERTLKTRVIYSEEERDPG